MRVLITGTSSGIGYRTALKFLVEGHTVEGIDIKESKINHKCYTHHKANVVWKSKLPSIKGIDCIINNAGTIDEKKAVDVNLVGYINIVERYAFNPQVECLVNVASISGHIGLDTMRYAASQGGRLALTKHLAMVLGKQYGTRVFSISPGAVMTGLEPELYKNKKLVKAVADESLLKKWADVGEIAEWIHFAVTRGKSFTGQDILIDNGEVSNYNFISIGRQNE